MDNPSVVLGQDIRYFDEALHEESSCQVILVPDHEDNRPIRYITPRQVQNLERCTSFRYSFDATKGFFLINTTGLHTYLRAWPQKHEDTVTSYEMLIRGLATGILWEKIRFYQQEEAQRKYVDAPHTLRMHPTDISSAADQFTNIASEDAVREMVLSLVSRYTSGKVYKDEEEKSKILLAAYRHAEGVTIAQIASFLGTRETQAEFLCRCRDVAMSKIP